MYPELFRIGSFPVNTYGVLLALAFLVGAVRGLAPRRARRAAARARLRPGAVDAAGGLVGSKLLLMVAEPEYGAATWRNLLSLDFLRSGGVWYGGFLGGLVDGRVPDAPLRAAVLEDGGRVRAGRRARAGHRAAGLLRRGCCWGKPTCDAAVGRRRSPRRRAPRSRACPTGVHLHPTQLYESFADAPHLPLPLWLHRRKRFDGQVIVDLRRALRPARFTIEFFRDDPRGDILGLTTLTGLSTSQLISLLVGLGGARLPLPPLAPRARRRATARRAPRTTRRRTSTNTGRRDGMSDEQLSAEPEAETLAFECRRRTRARGSTRSSPRASRA